MLNLAKKIQMNNMKVDEMEKPRITKWIETKLQKHIGFVIESVFEAFPQVLLNLILVFYLFCDICGNMSDCCWLFLGCIVLFFSKT